MRDQAIRIAHTDVVTIDDDIAAFDKDGNTVTLDEDKIKIELDKLKADYDAVEYQRKRVAEYPAVEDQLDMLWHAMDQGTLTKVDAFYDINKAVKDKYPKE
ncbi:MAG: hypothetical protein QGH83_08740 [Candidatus Pacebacteria bacterium]|jgi:hypothetical protein|nr:hypothetical protein [Candidatus Paceibacterota bacterium]